jgi:hypothetical protein
LSNSRRVCGKLSSATIRCARICTRSTTAAQVNNASELPLTLAGICAGGRRRLLSLPRPNILSVLPHLLAVGEAIFGANLTGIDGDVGCQSSEEKVMAWTFDTVSACLLIYRLLKRELNDDEIEMAGEVMNFSLVLKVWFFNDWYREPDKGKLQRFLKRTGMPFSEGFACLLIKGRQLFWSQLELHGCSRDELLKAISMLSENEPSKKSSEMANMLRP